MRSPGAALRSLVHVGTVALSVACVQSAIGYELVAFSTAKARPIALGGAYFSVEDELFSAVWNPASFGAPGFVRNADVRGFLMPVTSALALGTLATRSSEWQRDDRLTESEAIIGTLRGVKGFALSWHTWTVGFVNTDEPLRRRPVERPRWPAWNGIAAGTYTVAAAFKLAPEVVLGASVAREMRRDTLTVEGWSGSFGVLLRPRKSVNVGLAYVLRPAGIVGLADELERVDAGTINGGVSWYPWRGAVWSLDLRNLDNSDDRFGFAEVHVGIEQTILGLVSVRAGWYRVKEDGAMVYSGGVGIKPPWRAPNAERPGRLTDLLAYTLVWQNPGRDRGPDPHVIGDSAWHMLALTVPVGW